MKGGSTTNTSTVTPDRATLQFQQRAREAAARAAGDTGAAPQNVQDFLRLSQGLTGGLAAGQERGLLGVENFFNPFESQVISGVQTDFDRQRALAQQRAADVATRAGAFGGNRAAVLEALNTEAVNRNEASTLAGIRSSGFSDAVSRLLGERQRLGQLGLTGLQGLLQGQGFLDQRQRAALDQFLAAGRGFGSTTTTDTNQTRGNGLLGGLGILGTIGGALINPAGTVAETAVNALNSAGTAGVQFGFPQPNFSG